MLGTSSTEIEFQREEKKKTKVWHEIQCAVPFKNFASRKRIDSSPASLTEKHSRTEIANWMEMLKFVGLKVKKAMCGTRAVIQTRVYLIFRTNISVQTVARNDNVLAGVGPKRRY